MNNKGITYRLAPIILLIDQIIKIIVKHNLKLHQEVKIIPNFFSIYYVENKGAAFSLMKDSRFFLIIISIIFVLYLSRYIKKEKYISKRESICLGMMIGGIIGNLIDRIIHKGVIDYLSFTFFGYDFAIFNFADICICLGTILYVLFLLIKEKNKNERNIL